MLFPQDPVEHGGQAQGLTDLSASLNPLGAHPDAVKAAQNAVLGQYPSSDSFELIETAAQRHCISYDCVVPVPGSSWAIWFLLLFLSGTVHTLLIPTPDFSEYARTANMVGMEARTVPRLHGFEVDFDTLVARSNRHSCVIFSNPNNPSGFAHTPDQVLGYAERFSGIVIVDEAFAPLAPNGYDVLQAGQIPENMIVIRSLTKELALPGLRMGYIVANPHLTEKMRRCLPPWPLSAPSLAAAVVGLRDKEYGRKGGEVARSTLKEIAGILREKGMSSYDTFANYMLFRGPISASKFLERGLMVRDCSSFGLTGHIRISSPMVDDRVRVTELIKEIEP